MKNIGKIVRENGRIMQIGVNSTSMGEVLTGVEKFISDSYELGSRSTKFYIVTPNPELILMAQGDEELKDALNSADISVPDGVGLKIANPKLVIIKGRELFDRIVLLAKKHDWKVFLMGGMGKEAELAAIYIKKEFGNINIATDPGPKLNREALPITEADKSVEKAVIEKINDFAPDLLFVAFGNPKQEIWIHENLSKLNIGGAMAVGGTLRYVAGLAKLPPKWMSGVGLEWLWRLVTEPKRFIRIFNAVVVFPVKYFFYTLSH